MVSVQADGDCGVQQIKAVSYTVIHQPPNPIGGRSVDSVESCELRVVYRMLHAAGHGLTLLHWRAVVKTIEAFGGGANERRQHGGAPPGEDAGSAT